MKEDHEGCGITATLRSALLGVACTATVLLVGTSAASAQSSVPMVYPSQGQSVQQQSKDEAECRGWAQQQTGFNPSQGPTYYSSSGSGGQMVRGAAGGAALGAVGGAIGGNAGKGAAIGAGVGATFGLMRRSRQHRAQEQTNQQAVNDYNQSLANYNRGFATCMQGRGYAVN